MLMIKYCIVLIVLAISSLSLSAHAKSGIGDRINAASKVTVEATDGKGAWSLIKDKNDIQVYSRDVEGSNFFEFKGVIQIKADASSVVALLMDNEVKAKWMHKTKEVIELVDAPVNQEKQPGDAVAYMVFDFFPLPARDIVVKNTIVQDPGTRVVTFTMEYLPGHKKLKESGYGHMDDLHGLVTLTPLKGGLLDITYQAHIEPGLALLNCWLCGASAITNMLLESTPYYTLLNAKKTLDENPKYENTVLDFIINDAPVAPPGHELRQKENVSMHNNGEVTVNSGS